MKEFLKEIGINLPYITAGFLGGVVKAFLAGIAGSVRPAAVLAFMVVGAITANYITDLMTAYTGFPPGAVAFILGVIATVVCEKMPNLAGRLDHLWKQKGDQ